jgi:hypothetical protein
VRACVLARIAAAATGVAVGLAALAFSPARAGAAQAAVPATNYRTAGALSGLAAVSADDAWAVGTVGGGLGHALILHWNGKAWSQATGVPAIGGALYGVTATATSAWGATSALISRWNGKTWVSVKVPGGSYDLAGLGFAAADNGWAVGARGADTLILHWNGHSWS